MYAAMLNPKGKILHDFIVYRDEQGPAGECVEGGRVTAAQG